jgi:TadE-like protein
MRRRGTSGNMVIESALWIPVIVLLLVAMEQFARITYTYYSLRKAVYSAARYLSVQQGVNFCDLTDDPNVAAALQLAVTGTTDGSGTPLITGLTTDMLQVTVQCVDPASGTPGPCAEASCPSVAQRPDYIMVSIPNGYPVTPRIPVVTLQSFSLYPYVLVPFGGTT